MRFLSIRSKALSLMFLAFASHCVAQKPVIAAQFAAEPAVIERLGTVVAMQADGTGYRERTLAVKVQSDAMLRTLGVLSIPFASASEHVDFDYVRVRRPDGTVIETPTADAMEQPTAVTREAPFYSDQKEKQVPIRSLHVGDTLEWQVRIVRTKAEAPNQFWGDETFDDSIVTLDETFELHVPKATHLIVWTHPGLGKPVESTTATEYIYHWDHKNLKATAGAEAEAETKAKAKQLLTAEEELDLTDGKLPAIQWTTFANWQAVGAWYRGLELERTSSDAEIKAKVAELIKGKTTEEEKVRAVYAFVATQLRYIGVAFGVGRYQPHQASDVLANQYGDCKDKHTLLAAMLRELGLQPEAVLIGAQVRFNETVPTPAAFNHLITRVVVEGKPVWLDSTTEVAPYRLLLVYLRDKPALVIPPAGPAHLERTPADPPFPNLQTMKAVGALDAQGVSLSHLSFTLRGDLEVVVRSVLRQVPANHYNELAQKMSEGMGYSGAATNPQFSRIDDTSEPFAWSYDYKREQGGDWEHLRILPQLANRSLPAIDPKEPPVASIDLGVPRTEISSAEMKLPAGWSAELPEATHAKSEYATCDLTFRFANGIVYTDLKIVVLKRYVPAQDWKSYQKFVDAASLDNGVYVQLSRSGAAQLDAEPPSRPASKPKSSADQAAQLIRDAFVAMNKESFVEARAKLDEAEKLNPKQPELQGAYGALSYDRGEMSAAIASYQRELSAHPDAYWVYAPLSRAQDRTGRRTEAVATLRKWASVEPTNTTATNTLVEHLLADGKPADAVTAAEGGIADLPADKRDSPELSLALGKAQLKAGLTAKGSATLLGMLENASDSLTLNNAAYELADANQALPAAEAAARKALDQLSAESRAWTLDESPQTLRQKCSLIVSTWDTLGWILFREGKLAEAEDETAAAWQNHQSVEAGEHLGDIRAARGNMKGAASAYQQGISMVLPVSLSNPMEEARKLRMEAKLGKTKVSTNFSDEIGVLAATRRLTLTPVKEVNGTGVYKMLVSRNGVERVEPIDGHSFDGGAEVLQTLRLSPNFPQQSDVRLFKYGSLNCTGQRCVFTIQP